MHDYDAGAEGESETGEVGSETENKLKVKMWKVTCLQAEKFPLQLLS